MPSGFKRASRTGDQFLVDTRQEWEYRAGHIKRAVNFPMEPTWLARWQKKGGLGRFLGVVAALTGGLMKFGDAKKRDR